MRSAVWLLGIPLLTTPLGAEEGSSPIASVDVVVRLHEGRWYSPRDVCREINEKLGADRDPTAIDDRRRALTPGERLALIAAGETGLLRVRLEADRLVVSVPDQEDPEVRRRHRRRIARLLGIALEEWPEGTGLRVPPRFDPERRTVVLIHGLEAGPRAMDRLQTAFEASGIQVLRFDYPNDGPASVAGERLSRDLAGLAARHPGVRVALVAHSLGGLVARHALETPELNPGNVADLVCLGTPHQGSALAGMQPLLELIAEGLPNGLRLKVPLQSGLGEAGVDLRPGSRFLRELDRRDRPPGVRYHVGVGRRGLMTPELQEAVAARRRNALDAPNDSPTRRNRTLELLSAAELRHGAGDGAVTVESATLPGAASRRVFDRNHLELADLPGERPERCEVFVWILEALRWN